MHPRLLSFDLLGHPVTLSTYGFLVALGIMVGIHLGWRQARRVGIRTDDYLDLSLLGLVAALVGSRLWFVLTNLDRFAGRPWRVLYLWEGGLVFYGGVLAALAFCGYFMRRRGMPFRRVADIYAMVLCLGHAFGRMGCFMAGCCWGKASHGAVGVVFPPGSLVHDELTAQGVLPAASRAPTLPLHPVQLYEAGGELVIFGVLLAVAARKRFDGAVVTTYLLLYGVLRFVTELFRGDAARRFVAEVPLPGVARVLGLPPGEPLFLSTSQLVGLLTSAAAAAALLWLARRARRA